jgi:Zn-dependent peptidase ImmA (M78 family)
VAPALPAPGELNPEGEIVTQPVRSTDSLIKELVRSTGAIDAPTAIRLKAREHIELYVKSFGAPTLPIDLEVLASLRGITQSDERPLHSPDAELVPDGTGRVTMRVNPDRPDTRRRFSVAHEISHTFFPDYTTKAWCRTDSRFRDRTDPDEYLEMLCDIAAAELLFPQPWFSRDAAAVADASGLVRLAMTYHGSREATMRRYAETSPESVAAVFFTWKLKPTQKATIGQKDQGNLFGITPEQEVRDALRLRIEYAAMSETFKADGHFLPKDKSVENEGPLYLAASTGNPAENECFLDLGQAAGTYRVWAIPLWTAEDQLGSNRENTVAAILRPTIVRNPQRKRNAGKGPLLLGES